MSSKIILRDGKIINVCGYCGKDTKYTNNGSGYYVCGCKESQVKFEKEWREQLEKEGNTYCATNIKEAYRFYGKSNVYDMILFGKPSKDGRIFKFGNSKLYIYDIEDKEYRGCLSMIISLKKKLDLVKNYKTPMEKDGK